MKKLDLTGKVFNGILVIKEIAPNKTGQIYWECRCICGKIYTVRGSSIKSGDQKSCGCLNIAKCTKHGDTRTTFYRCWKGLKERCFNKNKKQYKDYGGRGITICERWLDYNLFKEDMFSTYETGLSIDRIDNNGNYEPKNCKWSTRKEQNSNTRRNNFVNTPHGKMTVMDVSILAGLAEHTIRHRLKIIPNISYENLILPAMPGVSLKQRVKHPV